MGRYSYGKKGKRPRGDGRKGEKGKRRGSCAHRNQ